MTVLLLLLGLVILTGGAEALVRGASGLALRIGLSPLVVGLTVVSFGTSSPELAVSVTSSFAGQGAVAVGNIIGSNIFNIAVILGISALICPLAIHVQLLRWDLPVMLVSSALFALLLVSGGGLVRWEAALLFILVVCYTVWTVRLGKKDAAAVVSATPAVPEKTGGMPLLVLLIIVGLAMLVGGSKLFVDNAVILARHVGMSEALVGLTIVAAGTSMPELATSMIAALHGKADLAVGNIVGSNTFNVLCIGGVAGLCRPIEAAGIGAFDILCMLGVSALLLPMMKTGFRIVRWEGAVLLAGYAGYLFMIWPT